MNATTTPLENTDAWKALTGHCQQIKDLHMRDLFAADPQRYEHFHAQAGGILLDYSKNRITAKTRRLLLNLARQAGVMEQAKRMYSGMPINTTEDQAVLHPLLRDDAHTPVCTVDDELRQQVDSGLQRMQHFAAMITSGQWRGHTGETITDIVNIGIGGSDLGPRMAYRALQPYQQPSIAVHFVSNVDGADITQVLAALKPERTLFIVASKTFATQETLTNAHTAKDWLIRALSDRKALRKHFCAVSANAARVSAFGIDAANRFDVWDWVSGRYSLWSAIGLPVAIGAGMDRFRELLAGAHAMDQHFLTAPAAFNLPLLLGLLGIWYINFFAAEGHAILPYDQNLEYLPSYLQQLDMESNGKRVTITGNSVAYHTSPIIWGAAGSNGQHSFHQLLHQGTRLIPADFLVAANAQHPLDDHHQLLLANCFAQSKALMQGKTQAEIRAELRATGQHGMRLETMLPHRTLIGNKPSNTLLYQTLNARTLGALIALYELKIFVQGVIWRLNSFDQWGVESGKQWAAIIASELTSTETGATSEPLDASTRALIKQCKRLQTKR